MDQVRKDLEQLNDMLLGVSYPDSEAARLAQLYDIPKVAGAVIWSRQIEHQVDKHLERVEILLGPDWEKNQEGRRLR